MHVVAVRSSRQFNLTGAATPRGENVNTLQLYLAVGLPTIAVLASLTVSLVQISGIREDMREMRRDLSSKIDGLDSKLDSKIDAINTKIDLLTGKVYELMAK
jgi:hypothetical protein